VPSEVLSAMGQALAHRGPDGEGTFAAGPVGLIHRRLAIIDLEGGRQPLSNEDASIHVVFNGEIYNYRELRTRLERRGHNFRTNSDTEVLVHLYEDHGAELCQHLRGMFAFAIWDARRQQLLLGRDHLGQKPLYVYRDGSKLLFGSELKAILAHPGVDRAVSPAAIEDFLTFGFIPGPRSVFQRISKLPPAHTLLVSAANHTTSPRRYWNLSFAVEQSLSVSEWQERLEAALRDSVQAHLVADVEVGAFLSGGLDSSAIVGLMRSLRGDSFPVFSIGFREAKFSELTAARAVARQYGCRMIEEIVTPDAARDLADLTFLYDEPFADASAIPTMAVSRLAAQHVKVVLSGDGGDELFGGYARYAHDLGEAAIRRRLPRALRSLLSPLAAAWPRLDWLPRPLRWKSVLQNLALDPAAAYANTVAQCRQSVRQQLMHRDLQSRLHDHDPERVVREAFALGARDSLSGMLAADSAILLPDDFLTKVDRASMGFGLEVRPPFVDRSLMELAASMPSDLKIRDGATKWILRRMFEPRMPAELSGRPKQGFELPVDAWLRGPLRDRVEASVISAAGPLQGLININAARRLAAAHQRGSGRHGQVLWSLLILASWLESWTRGEPTRTAATTSRIRNPSSELVGAT
jgi:asparagine synthase (glutamine-hydrolysing)